MRTFFLLLHKIYIEIKLLPQTNNRINWYEVTFRDFLWFISLWLLIMYHPWYNRRDIFWEFFFGSGNYLVKCLHEWKPIKKLVSEVRIVPGLTIRPNLHALNRPMVTYRTRPYPLDPYKSKFSIRIMCTHGNIPSNDIKNFRCWVCFLIAHPINVNDRIH